MKNIIIATIKEWNISNYFKIKHQLKSDYTFHLITNKEELTLKNISKINPKYIFFPHWSWKIDDTIFQKFECIIFHETDLPYGRGGSPIQNLISRGIYNTKISALQACEEIDAGDIYLKKDFSLLVGSAQENFINISNIIFNELIQKILFDEIVPIPQKGEIVSFKRRTPKESNIQLLKEKTIIKLYDFIRMLDADSYPKAYLNLENLNLEFSEVHLKNKTIVGRFEVKENA